MDAKHDILQPSGYDEGPVSSGSEIFADKKPIKNTGTTCHAFSARYESRYVFVKQLKPEYSSNPVYRSAFQKEYELGASIRHPSITQYIKFTGDTLITEFVDGKTLHQMIQENDPRLHCDNNIEKWVSQLLDVMDYLHRKNVIHCDIKTDNIMITNDTRNLMLIDFDKAFTASQDLTPGTPLNFGSEDENLTKRQMDMRGIGMIVERLMQFTQSRNLKKRLSRIVKASKNPDLSLPDLNDLWNSHSKNFYKYIGLTVGIISVISILIFGWLYYPFRISDEKNKDKDIIFEEGRHDIGLDTNHETSFGSINENPVIQKESNSNKGLTPLIIMNILGNDIRPLKQYLDKVSKQLNENKVDYQLAETYNYDIRDLSLNLDYKVLEKFNKYYDSLSREDLLKTIYSFNSVNEVIDIRNDVLDRLFVIMNYTDKGNETPSQERIKDCIEAINQQTKIEFSPLVLYMSEVTNLINAGEITRENVNSYLDKLNEVYRECENKVADNVTIQYPEFDRESILGTVVTVDSFQPIFNEWSSVQSKLYAILREKNVPD